jgi:hypothetical protein
MASTTIYYCSLCGDYCFLTKDFKLSDCPERPEDETTVVDEDEKVIKSTLRDGESLIIQRDKRFEKQERQNCAKCGVTISYHQGGKFLYILKGTLTTVSNVY